MRRREVLLSIAGTATLAAAGCSAAEDEELPDDALRFFVTNEDDVQRSVAVEIHVDGGRSGASGTLPPAGEGGEPFQYTYPGEGVAVEALVESDNGGRSLEWDPADCSELHVDARIVDGEPQLREECQ